MLFALAFATWPTMMRIVRGAGLSMVRSDYVLAAKAMGATRRQLLRRHIIPNVVVVAVGPFALAVAAAVMAEASLSFLGIGTRAPEPSLGTMIARGRERIFDAPHLVVFPSLVLIAVTVPLGVVSRGFMARAPRRARTWRESPFDSNRVDG
jgi:ABC-type dipeptide/oligopeptide/nickel transport system permease subunit